MAKNVERPIIFPLSNPVSRCEATPQQLVDWTEGRALIGTGSPFPPASYQGKPAPFAQTNNSYIFPGLALGILSSRARHVSEAMVKAATLALAAELGSVLYRFSWEKLIVFGANVFVVAFILFQVAFQRNKKTHDQAKPSSKSEISAQPNSSNISDSITWVSPTFLPINPVDDIEP